MRDFQHGLRIYDPAIELCLCFIYRCCVLCSVSVLSVEAGIKGHQPQEKTDQQSAKE